MKSETTPVRIAEPFVEIARLHKNATGIPIQRFIEDAIVEKADRLPKDILTKMGISPKRKSSSKTK
jgi:hypothetical protein